MELPFAGKKTVKPIHVQFIDALEELSKQTAKKFPTYRSNAGWDKWKDKAMEEGLEEAWAGLDNSECIRPIMASFIEDYIGEGDLHTNLFSDAFIKNEQFKKGKLDFDDMRSSMNDLAQFGTEAFSKKGIKLLKHYFPEIIDSILSEGEGKHKNCLFPTIEENMDDDGLIKCWRAIVIDENRISGRGKNTDLYDEMTKWHKGVGRYWSWDEDAAQPYNGYSSSAKRLDVLLHGRARPEDVEWGRTVFMNVYDLKEEQEITLKGHVKIDAVEFETPDGKKVTQKIDGLIIPIGQTGPALPKGTD